MMDINKFYFIINEINKKLDKLDLNSLSKDYFEKKVIFNIDCLKHPEKIEITNLLFNELYQIFKILITKLNVCEINLFNQIFFFLRESISSNSENYMINIIHLIFGFYQEFKLNIPLLKKENKYKEQNEKEIGDFPEYNIYFLQFENKIRKFLENRNNFLNICKKKTKEFYNYLMNDFEKLINLKRKTVVGFPQFFSRNIEDYFKSDSHFEMKVFYEDSINKKIFYKEKLYQGNFMNIEELEINKKLEEKILKRREISKL